MLITDDFVFVHMPKTGGTFVQNMLKRVYPHATELETHLSCSDIPEQAKGMPILSIVRHPMDRYVSQYHFGWWRLHPNRYCSQAQWQNMGVDPKTMSFGDFIYVSDTYFKGHFEGQSNGFANRKADEPLGWHTEQFIRFFYRDAKEVYAELDEQSIQSGAYQQAEYPVTFLHTESLNQQLVDFLKQQNLAPSRVEFILEQDKLQPKEGTKRPAQDTWQPYFHSELATFVRNRERLLFQRFPYYQNQVGCD
ncbi:sulfotransferase family 2 domain-containing protein [Pseudoalteromonas sp. S16_S37]|uniref:sulfotransferase family 2 domain-containing protein n=1 Tax=Pseudoalteromonas sp. S16_S37 TaxID=2720228 RepID=UPI0016816CC1|nr:sulfotransferase family 2 domain-containing protein [Pseudoalteromonas sp. S16_S37]MBD1580678.1 sulfotransferase family 2 domain-containing protein [Pseudoalteromonas sp. S16_S37]